MVELNQEIDLVVVLCDVYIVVFTVSPDRGFVGFLLDVSVVCVDHSLLCLDGTDLSIFLMGIGRVFHSFLKVNYFEKCSEAAVRLIFHNFKLLNFLEQIWLLRCEGGCAF